MLKKYFIEIYNLFYNQLLKKFFYNFLFWIKRRKINKENYKIISIGSYCMSRCIVTYNGLKPRKKEGEKSCPFDLVLFDKFESIINLIDSRFETLYKNLEYNSVGKYWYNKEFNASFVHDHEKSLDDFIKKYDRRIENFYNYINDQEKHIFFLLSTFEKLSEQQLKKTLKVLNRYIDNSRYSLIIVNQGQEKNPINFENVITIEQAHNFDKFQYINNYKRKGTSLAELKKRRTSEAHIIYNEITEELIKIIKQKIN